MISKQQSQFYKKKYLIKMLLFSVSSIFQFLPASLSLYSPLCLSIFLSVSLSFFFLLVCMFLSLSFYFFISLARLLSFCFCPSYCLIILFLRLAICLSFCRSPYLHAFLFRSEIVGKHLKFGCQKNCFSKDASLTFFLSAFRNFQIRAS